MRRQQYLEQATQPAPLWRNPPWQRVRRAIPLDPGACRRRFSLVPVAVDCNRGAGQPGPLFHQFKQFRRRKELDSVLRRIAQGLSSLAATQRIGMSLRTGNRAARRPVPPSTGPGPTLPATGTCVGPLSWFQQQQRLTGTPQIAQRRSGIPSLRASSRKQRVQFRIPCPIEVNEPQAYGSTSQELFVRFHDWPIHCKTVGTHASKGIETGHEQTPC